MEIRDSAAVSRRQLFALGTAAGVGGVAAITAQREIFDKPKPRRTNEIRRGREPFHGAHQAGVTTPGQAHATFVGLDLRPGSGADELGRLLRLLTSDAARLTQGDAALADTEPELAQHPARLTVTAGFGPGAFRAAARTDRTPAGFAQLPEFGIDKLESQWCGGDLLLQLCSDDPLTLSHALRVLINDAKAFAVVRWSQRGFRNAADTSPAGTPRNLMGQLDGTANPQASNEFDEHVWVRDGSWLDGGTTLVLRRIRMELEKWDILDRGAKELAVGRRLRSGAPLGGRRERDSVDLTAIDSNGLQVIPPAAHVRRAREGGAGQCLLRRGYNYDDGPRPDGSTNAGLIFAAYQANIERQFLPIQQRLAAMDALNEWTTPIGSAVFVLPPGCRSNGWLGETLLS